MAYTLPDINLNATCGQIYKVTTIYLIMCFDLMSGQVWFVAEHCSVTYFADEFDGCQIGGIQNAAAFRSQWSWLHPRGKFNQALESGHILAILIGRYSGHQIQPETLTFQTNKEPVSQQDEAADLNWKGITITSSRKNA